MDFNAFRPKVIRQIASLNTHIFLTIKILSDSEDMDEKQQKSHRNPMLLANGTFVKREKSA